MPWSEHTKKNAKILFVADYLKGTYTFTKLCHIYGVSRKTGYALVNAFLREGENAFTAKSRARHHHPNVTCEAIKERVIAVKTHYLHWGPRKIRDWLRRYDPEVAWPAASTIGEILKQGGLVKPRKKRHRVPSYTRPFAACDAPNKSWSADFKGQFPLQNGRYCYPLTVTDNYSRYVLGCDGYYRPNRVNVMHSFKHLFRTYGLPEVIRTDNGQPFASPNIGGLTALSVWWLKLGIMPERIQPGHPEQNGRHERMHRTLKQHTTQPPQANMTAQQQCFERFLEEFNHERPHEALNTQPPAAHYTPSVRPFPEKLPELIYDDALELRKIRSNGEIKWQNKKIYLCELLKGETVAIESIDEHRGILYFSKLKLGIIDSKTGEIFRINK